MPTSKKKGTFQMWWSPNGMSDRSTSPYTVKASAGLLVAAQCENDAMPLPIGGHTRLSPMPTKMAANAVRMGTERLPAKKPR